MVFIGWSWHLQLEGLRGNASYVNKWFYYHCLLYTKRVFCEEMAQILLMALANTSSSDRSPGAGGAPRRPPPARRPCVPLSGAFLTAADSDAARDDGADAH
eukprot:COSAG04_NODE_884_length_9654_cov_39.264155_9_plen_101_part_00